MISLLFIYRGPQGHLLYHFLMLPSSLLYCIVLIQLNLISDYVSCFIAFQALRNGVLDVIPSSAFDNLTAEDFRLLLNGCGEVNVQQLMSYTSFNDETGGKQVPHKSLIVLL